MACLEVVFLTDPNYPIICLREKVRSLIKTIHLFSHAVFVDLATVI